jgi:hypothetical protein
MLACYYQAHKKAISSLLGVFYRTTKGSFNSRRFGFELRANLIYMLYYNSGPNPSLFFATSVICVSSFPYCGCILSYACNRPWRPIGLWDVEARKWRSGCQAYAPAALYSPGRFLVLIPVRGWVDLRTIARLEGLGKLKSQMTSSGIVA